MPSRDFLPTYPPRLPSAGEGNQGSEVNKQPHDWGDVLALAMWYNFAKGNGAHDARVRQLVRFSLSHKNGGVSFKSVNLPKSNGKEEELHVQ